MQFHIPPDFISSSFDYSALNFSNFALVHCKYGQYFILSYLQQELGEISIQQPLIVVKFGSCINHS